ncbi:MAG: DNA recombination protein RmuC [Culicoidibacterales bacterium]
MEILIVILLVLVFITMIGLLIVLIKGRKADTSQNSVNMLVDMIENRHQKIIAQEFVHVTDNLSTKVEGTLQKNNETFTSISERLAKIDEAQKNIVQLSGNIISLQDILSDKKTRGIFGEIQLNQALKAIYGEPKQNLYLTQYKLNNGTIADAVLFAPEPLGMIAIDSKFPLENFKRMTDQTLSPEEIKSATANFKTNMQKHIDDIAKKYIIEGTTSNQAILFLPAEAIFAEVHANHGTIIEYAHKKRIWITSPTTLMAVLNTIQAIVRDIQREEYAHKIHEELNVLTVEFKRYQERWAGLDNSIETLYKKTKEVRTTSDKISKKFEAISQGEFE